MNRRDFLKTMAVSAGGGSLLSNHGLDLKLTSRPNIVFLMADDHQAMAMGCMGNSEIATPNLDALAGKGVVFERCYASSPLCMASRATVFTGMYEYKTGCNFSTGKVSADDWNDLSYATLLRRAGYRTAFAGKWGFGVDIPDHSAAFDKWGGFEGSGQGSYNTGANPSMTGYAQEYPHVTRGLGAFGRDFIRESAANDKPFCLTLFFKAPHKPHNNIDAEDLLRYDGATFATRPNYGESAGQTHPIQPKLGRQYHQWTEWDPDSYQDHLKAYYQLISGVDTAVGMVIDELEARGVADNTVIIYTSDNGYFCGSHRLQGKVLPYEEASRIPLIIYDPRSRSAGKKQRSRAVVSNIDFAPTVLDLAGLKTPGKMDGKSLTGIVDSPAKSIRDSSLVIQNWGWANTDHNRALAVVTEDYKYINWCYADENVPVAEELFDMVNDPYELNDLSADPEASSALERMRALYDEYHRHWSRHCVDAEDYTRHRVIFDRTVPWQDKDYRGFTVKNKDSSGGKAIRQIYEDLTGVAPPIN